LGRSATGEKINKSYIRLKAYIHLINYVWFWEALKLQLLYMQVGVLSVPVYEDSTLPSNLQHKKANPCFYDGSVVYCTLL
jgi:hypothetical protein